MPHPQRIEPGPGQESVWNYPRPPRLEAVTNQVEVIFASNTIAITLEPLRVLETSHPPVYYFPPGSFIAESVVPSGRTSYCEFKGTATYLDVVSGKHRAPNAAWRYDDPVPAFGDLAGHVAFYPALMDVCLLDGEFVNPQPGGFYGGWVTSKVVGPFKGEPGTETW